MSVFERIIEKLKTANVPFETSHHAPTRTSEDAARIRGVEMHSGAKALVLLGNKSGQHWLFVMPADLKLNSQLVRKIVGEPVSFAPDVEAVTSCVPGSVSPFGSVIGLKTYCDLRLSENTEINFNAGSLTDSICMKYEDYARVEQPELVDIAK